MENKLNYQPFDNLPGGYSSNDGTIDFYLRTNALINKNFTVLDFGAGRAGWYEDDKCETRKKVRYLKGKVNKLIAADVDEIVLQNKASDEQILITNKILGLEKDSVDLVIADYVLEHIEDIDEFFSNVNYVLKDGGWFCARTPHKYCYVVLASKFIKDFLHSSLLNYIQPDRKTRDVFPAFYKLNTMRDIKRRFDGWENRSYIFKSDPAYYFGNKYIYKIQQFLHTHLPAVFSGNLFIFLKKQ